jgi:hypothetical protein
LEKIFTERKGGGSGWRTGSPMAALLWRARAREEERRREKKKDLGRT